jgi:L-alanine-DL-glutamate epimerase-like enolase superfamily enzyme
LIEVKPLRNPMQHELVARPIEHASGWFAPPGGPGLGIEVIDEVVDFYRAERSEARAGR